MNWTFEIEEMMSSTSDEVNLHYAFILRIGKLFEQNNYSVDQVIILDEIVDANHMVYMSLFKDVDSIEIGFPFSNTSTQKFTVSISKINNFNLDTSMGFNLYTEVFGDNNYFDIILLNTINNLINIVDENGIY